MNRTSAKERSLWENNTNEIMKLLTKSRYCMGSPTSWSMLTFSRREGDRVMGPSMCAAPAALATPPPCGLHLRLESLLVARSKPSESLSCSVMLLTCRVRNHHPRSLRVRFAIRRHARLIIHAHRIQSSV